MSAMENEDTEVLTAVCGLGQPACEKKSFWMLVKSCLSGY